jgi:hypothetical protein
MYGSLIGTGIILPFVCKSIIEKQNYKLNIIIISIFTLIFLFSVILDLKLYAETYTLDLILAMFLVLFLFSLISSISLLIYTVIKQKNVKPISIIMGTSLILVIIFFALVGSGIGENSSSSTETNLVSETENTDDDADSESDVKEASSSVESSSSSSSSSSVKQYEAVSYDNLARNPDDYKMKSVTISGQVMQVQKAGKGYMLLVWQNDDSDQLIMVSVPKSYKPDNGNILEDDEVTINGYAYGTQEYDTTGGSTNDVPLIYADQTVVDNGKSSNAY